ncbi:MAG: NADH-dependent [FeFe] hydrogenase, group A6 [Defluviitaleaceae bacterium]|nr:NADH-dependent [FeFe] hydrogenase, group A6 [Defluviitaleaceae bacterium]
MVNLTINGVAIEVEEGVTIMEAAKRNHINIPSLCYLENIHKVGVCRVCSVEVEGARNMQAACNTAVRPGMVVHTNTERLRQYRRVLYELMLSDHSQDCLSCVRNQTCEFQALGRLLGVDASRFEGARSQYHVDASVSITRDMSKCILCRRCVTACGHIQEACVLAPQNRGFDTEISPAMSLPIGSVNCAFCGQCTVVCPVGALSATDATMKVWAALGKTDKRRVVQVAPAVRVAIGEEFGMAPGSRVTGKLAAALRRLGFDDVFDTNFAADLTIIEEGTELIHRLQNALTGKKAVLPMITSCSPGWIKYVENHFPEQLGHLSTCKSPHMMMGAVVKSYYAEKIGRKPEDMYMVSVMPCTAKKFEIAREEMKNNGVQNVDAVITTRELGDMIKAAGIDFANLPDEDFDNPLGMSTGAADIFGITGGVMEAALRTVYELVTGRELPFVALHVPSLLTLTQVKEAEVTFENVLPAFSFLAGVTAKLAVTSGLAGAHKLLEQIEKGESPYHFIEVMGCPGGCITGGGQPRSKDPEVRIKRLSGLYSEDESKVIRKSHDNPYIQALYKDFLGEPNGHLSHELLHTHYVRRGMFNELSGVSYSVEPNAAMKRKAKPKQSDAGVVSEAPRQDSGEQAAMSMHLMEIEAENARLKSQLDDANETMEILKSVLKKNR